VGCFFIQLRLGKAGEDGRTEEKPKRGIKTRKVEGASFPKLVHGFLSDCADSGKNKNETPLVRRKTDALCCEGTVRGESEEDIRR